MALYGNTDHPIWEALINGVWTDLSSRVREDGRISLSRGRANEQGRVSAQICNFQANNRDGLLSNRLPSSTYFRSLPRNTQVRIGAGTGDTYVRYPMDYVPTTSDRAFTPDAAALDVVSDIEVRVDITPATWRPRRFSLLAMKWSLTTNQRSWYLALSPEGKLIFSWTTDGTMATRVVATSTTTIPTTVARLSLKATLDVVNGANKSAAFYTSGSIDGTYAQLGTTITTAGTTSIFSGSAAVTLGQGDDSTTVFSDADAYRGKFHKFRMYSGIAGSIVANPDFTVQTLRATSFADSPGRTWMIGGVARVTSDRLRFWGELGSVPQQSDITGTDVYVPVTAAGQIRRLTQGASPLRGSIYRALIGRSMSGFWPLGDGSSSSSAANAVSGGQVGQVQAITFATEGTLPGADAAPVFTTQAGKFTFTPLITTTTNTAYFTMYFKLTALPASTVVFATLNTTGTARRVTISVSPTTFQFEFWASDGTSLSVVNVLFGTGMTPTNQWLAMNVLITSTAGTVSWYARWSNVAAQSFVGVGPNVFSGSAGRISQVTITANNSATFIGTAVSSVHTSTSDLDFVNDALAFAANAYLLERAGRRLLRLGLEESVSVELTGDPDQTEQMGYQTTASFMDIVYDCAETDRGRLAEARDALAITYRTRVDSESARNATLDYALSHLAAVPVSTEDDQGITNDVTVTRTTGSSGRREITSGYMSVSPPPVGIGRYDTAILLNAGNDSRLDDIASWVANTGSVDEARYPNLTVGMHRTVIVGNTVLTASIAALDVGDTTTLTGMPSYLPPDDVALINEGLSETLGRFLWTIVFNTTPAAVYNVGRYDYETDVGFSRRDHASSTLAAGATSSAISLSVQANSTTPVTPDLWTTNGAMFPFDIIVAGERMTVTNITGASSPQTFTVTRSVNAVVKAQLIGARVQLFTPVTYGLGQ